MGRRCLEAAGFRVGDAGDFLGLTEDERRLVELRLAVRMKSSQSRIAKIEAGEPEVTLDLSIRALFAAGGELSDLAGMGPARKRVARKGRRPGRRAKVPAT